MGGGRGLSVSDVKLTPEPGPSMNSVLLRWTPSLNIRSKLKGQCKTIKYGSDIPLGTWPTSPQSQFENFSHDTVPFNIHSKLQGQRKTIIFRSDTSLEPSLAPHSLSLTV